MAGPNSTAFRPSHSHASWRARWVCVRVCVWPAWYRVCLHPKQRIWQWEKRAATPNESCATCSTIQEGVCVICGKGAFRCSGIKYSSPDLFVSVLFLCGA